MQEVYFFNTLFLLVNIAAFRFSTKRYVRILRYHYLKREREIKTRWLEQRKNVQEFKKTRNIFKHSNIDSTEPDEDEELVTHDLSFFVLIGSNISLFLANIFSYSSLLPVTGVSDLDFQRWVNIFLGVGSFFSWMNILNIMSLWKELSVVGSTLKRTLKEIGQLLYGIIPVYLAFLFAGYCAFHTHERFDTLQKMGASLGAILCGDEISGFIHAGMDFGTIGLFYAMAFCILFLVCIHNVLIYVVTEAFKQYEFEVNSKRKHAHIAHKKELISGIVTPLLPQISELHIIEDEVLLFRCRDSVLSDRLSYEKEVIHDIKHIDRVKKMIFDATMPDNKSQQFSEMFLRIDFIKEDLQHLHQSFEDLVKEELSRICLIRPCSEV